MCPNGCGQLHYYQTNEGPILECPKCSYFSNLGRTPKKRKGK